MRLQTWTSAFVTIVVAGAFQLSSSAPAAAQDDPNLWEMPYVATSVATDIFSGIVVETVETIDVGKSRYFPQFDTIYRVEVGTVVKGDLITGDSTTVRHRGGELNGERDYGKDTGPLENGLRYLFVTTAREGPDYLQVTGYLDSSILLETDEDEAEWVGRWRTASMAGECAGYLDMLRLNGTVYARRPWNADKRYLEPEWVGKPIATVQRQDYALYGCSSELKDGDASLLAAGTEILELNGYSPSFRVAVRLPDKHRWLYEAIWSESATDAEDMLDIRDRIVEVSYGRNSYCNDEGCVDYAGGSRPLVGTAADVVEDILASPVIPHSGGLVFFPEDQSGFVKFFLEDGSIASLTFNICSGVSTNGVRISPDTVSVMTKGYDGINLTIEAFYDQL